MKLPTNGVAKDIRHYAGSLFIFLLVIGIVFILMQFPVLETNKEVVMMLIGTISASLGIVISTITGSKPDDVQALKQTIEKKDHQIELLVEVFNTLIRNWSCMNMLRSHCVSNNIYASFILVFTKHGLDRVV